MTTVSEAFDVYAEIQRQDRQHIKGIEDGFRRFRPDSVIGTSDDVDGFAAMDAKAKEFLFARDWVGVLLLLSSRVRALGLKGLRRFMTENEFDHACAYFPEEAEEAFAN